MKYLISCFALAFAGTASALSYTWQQFEWIPKVVDGNWEVVGGGKPYYSDGQIHMSRIECRVRPVEEKGWYNTQTMKGFSLVAKLWDYIADPDALKDAQTPADVDIDKPYELQFTGFPNAMKLRTAKAVISVNGAEEETYFENSDGEYSSDYSGIVARGVEFYMPRPEPMELLTAEDEPEWSQERLDRWNAEEKSGYERDVKEYKERLALIDALFGSDPVTVKGLGMELTYTDLPSGKLREALDSCIQQQFDYWKSPPEEPIKAEPAGSSSIGGQ